MHHCSRSWVRSLATPLKSLVPLYIVGPALPTSHEQEPKFQPLHTLEGQ